MSLLEVTEQNFEQEVLKSDVPVLADLWAPWCGPCKAIAPTVEKISEEYGSKAKVVKINIDKSPGIASKYSVMSIPTLLFFKKGKVADQVIGVVGKEKISAKLDKLV
ncbi:MAG: thioredoxin 1 [Candidatus Cloacimonadota bacterium]|nr:thioredoxin 1 [Candidatus Cloacimonadota bacterium]